MLLFLALSTLGIAIAQIPLLASFTPTFCLQPNVALPHLFFRPPDALVFALRSSDEVFGPYVRDFPGIFPPCRTSSFLAPATVSLVR